MPNQFKSSREHCWYIGLEVPTRWRENTNMLTYAELKALKPQDKPYKVFDGGGVHVLVTPSGSRLWRLAYRFLGKQKTMTFGAFPDVSIAEARDLANQAKRALREGRDPGHEKKMKKRRERIAAGHTFALVANEWFEKEKHGWVPTYANRLRSRLDDDLLPQFGHRPISEIEPIEVLDAIRKIENRGAVVMAQRVMQMASAVFCFAVATGRCSRDPTADLKGALRPAKPAKSRTALRASDLPAFLHKLHKHTAERKTLIALELVVLTFVRTQELRFARWVEFENLDGSEPLWRIPADRMKMRRDHLVPLAPQAAKLLKELRGLTGETEYLFSAPTRSKVISENTMIQALYDMGYYGRATVHGFRATASTILNEKQFNRDWIEMQLAHFEGSVRSVYNAAEWLPGRRQMMAWWANYLDTARDGKSLISLVA